MWCKPKWPRSLPHTEWSACAVCQPYNDQCWTSIRTNRKRDPGDMEHFDQFTYGWHTVVQSDHKPLEAIMKKPLSKAPLHLQRMLLRLQRYDITITYLPGKDMLIADSLSHACKPGATVRQSRYTHANCIQTLTCRMLRSRTCRVLMRQMPLCNLSCLLSRPDGPMEKEIYLHPYCSIRDQISHDQGLLLKREKG